MLASLVKYLTAAEWPPTPASVQGGDVQARVQIFKRKLNTAFAELRKAHRAWTVPQHQGANRWPRGAGELPISWPPRAASQAETPGSEFCLHVAFLPALVLTAGPSRAHLQQLPSISPREKLTVCVQRQGPSEVSRSVRCERIWRLLDKASTSLNLFPILILPKVF